MRLTKSVHMNTAKESEDSLSDCETLQQMVESGWSAVSRVLRSSVMSADPDWVVCLWLRFGPACYPKDQLERWMSSRPSLRGCWLALLCSARCPRARHWTLNRPGLNCSTRRDNFWDCRCWGWYKTFISTAHVNIKLPCQTQFIKWTRMWARWKKWSFMVLSVTPAVWLLR